MRLVIVFVLILGRGLECICVLVGVWMVPYQSALHVARRRVTSVWCAPPRARGTLNVCASPSKIQGLMDAVDGAFDMICRASEL